MRVLIQRAVTMTKGPIARGSIKSVAIQSSGVLLAIAQGSLTARLLGADGYGAIAFALAIAQIVGTLAALGLGRLGVRDIPTQLAGDNTGAVRIFVRHAVSVGTLVSVLAAAGMAGLALFTPAFPEYYRTAIAISALFVPAITISLILRSALRGFGAVVLGQLPGAMLRPAAMIAVMAVLYFAGRTLGVEDYLLLSLGALLISFVVTAFFVRRILAPLPAATGVGPSASQLVGSSLPFAAMGITTLLQGYLSTLMLGSLASAEQVGLFQPLERFAPLMLIPVQAAGMRYAPRIAQFWHNGEIDRLRSVTWTFTWTTTALTVCAALVAIIVGPWILLLFGKDFHQLQSAIWILAATQIINAAFGPVGMLQVAIGNDKLAMANQIMALAINFALGLWLIPAHGAMGAVMAFSAAIIAGNLIQGLFVWRTIGMVTLILRGPPRSAAI